MSQELQEALRKATAPPTISIGLQEALRKATAPPTISIGLQEAIWNATRNTLRSTDFVAIGQAVDNVLATGFSASMRRLSDTLQQALRSTSLITDSTINDTFFQFARRIGVPTTDIPVAYITGHLDEIAADIATISTFGTLHETLPEDGTKTEQIDSFDELGELVEVQSLVVEAVIHETVLNAEPDSGKTFSISTRTVVHAIAIFYVFLLLILMGIGAPEWLTFVNSTIGLPVSLISISLTLADRRKN